MADVCEAGIQPKFMLPGYVLGGHMWWLCLTLRHRGCSSNSRDISSSGAWCGHHIHHDLLALPRIEVWLLS